MPGSIELLRDKRILVTGGSRGLGRAFCEEFAKQGAHVAFTYSRDEAGAAETGKRLSAYAGQWHSSKISVLDVAGMEPWIQSLEKEWGPVDVLVNNAGVSEALPLALMDEADWDRVMDTNVKGVYAVSRAVLPGMVRRRKGAVLNIGSLAGVRMIEAPIHYCASKAAVKAFTEALAKEVGRYKIRVNCLAPGLLLEGVAQNLPDYKLEEFIKHVALHRRGTLEEVAEAAAFLISDLNSYMTGATILMDGGL